MRLWSLHPQHLDRAGLLACWREALLARAVLAGRTRGYRHHPQLERFLKARSPLAAINRFLREVADEARSRGYRFDLRKIRGSIARRGAIPVATGQIEFERGHLLAKLRRRDPARARAFAKEKSLLPNPCFRAVPGGIEPWEKSEGAK